MDEKNSVFLELSKVEVIILSKGYESKSNIHLV